MEILESCKCPKLFPLEKGLGGLVKRRIKSANELEGHDHGFEEIYQKDISKQKDLEKMRLTVLRLTEGEVRHSADHMLQVVIAFLQSQI